MKDKDILEIIDYYENTFHFEKMPHIRINSKDYTNVFYHDNSKYIIGDLFPCDFYIYSPSFYTKYLLKRGEEQMILIFYVPSAYDWKQSENHYKTIQSTVKTLREKYKDKVLCYFVMYDCGFKEDILLTNDYKKSSFYSYFAKHFKCLFTNASYERIYSKSQYILTDKRGIIRSIGYFYDDYNEPCPNNFYPIIDSLLNNKPILRELTREEVDEKVKAISAKWQEIVKSQNMDLFNHFFKVIDIVPSRTKDLFFIYDSVFISTKIEDKSFIDNIRTIIKEDINSDQKKGIIQSTYINVYTEKINFVFPHECYKCKCKLTKEDFSYICVKCTLAGKPKQYCSNCVTIFSSYKKFTSIEYRDHNEIEEYNKYIHNKEEDDMKCNLFHLLILIPPNGEDILSDKLPYFTTYLQNSYYNDKTSIVDIPSCKLCTLFTPKEQDESYGSDEEYQYINKQFKCDNCNKTDKYLIMYPVLEYNAKCYYCFNQLTIPFDRPKKTIKRTYEYINFDRTVNAYGPIYYCLACRMIVCWICFTKFHKRELKGKEEYSLHFLKEQNDIDYEYPEFQDNGENKKYEFKRFKPPFKSEGYEEIFNNDGIDEDDIDTINECIEEGEFKDHNTTHPYLVISSRHVEILYKNPIDYSI